MHKPLSPQGREFKKVKEAMEEINKISDRREVGKSLERKDSFQPSTIAGNVEAESEHTHQTLVPSAFVNPRTVDGSSSALQIKLDAAMKAEEVGVPPDAADKWKVLQLFHDTVARARARVERVRRIVDPTKWAKFNSIEGLEIGYYTPAGPSQLARLQETGFCYGDFEEMLGDRWGIPVSDHANVAYDRVCRQFNLLGQCNRGGERCICVLLCVPGALSDGGSADSRTRKKPSNQQEHCVTEPDSLLLAYVLELGVV